MTLIDARQALTARVIPQMVLSEGTNPLTAYAPMDSGLTAAERAFKRFAITGNAIVTGGSGFIGMQVIRALLEHGASGCAIFDVAVSIETSKENIKTLQSDFPNARIITKVVDVTDEKVVINAVAETATELGSIDILLCFAGIVSTIHAMEMSAESFRKVLDVNTTGSWLCAQAAAKKMAAQGTKGSIVFTASISGHTINFPQPQVSYNVSKASLLQMAKSLAAEWAQFGIRVNSISPGYMDTILNHGDGLAEARGIWYSHNPMGRMGDPEELTGAVILLCSRAGTYITGEDICVDGGQTIF